ncbi:hypothetical protein R4Y45_04295 [Holzapfeliella sp. He02]|uniref:Uncharacterized protein n=1 Tax=Holzapfeliella saturejae TaxID=3082953 RepID=A0ABU8SGE1_9LACO
MKKEKETIKEKGIIGVLVDLFMEWTPIQIITMIFFLIIGISGKRKKRQKH